MKIPFLPCLLAAAFFASPLYGQDDIFHQKPPLETPGYNWQADAKQSKLSEKEIATLKQRGFVVTAAHYRQIFDPYVSGSQVFITSDTVINAYCILLEDSVQRLERVNSRNLRKYLEDAWKELDAIKANTKGDEALIAAATDRARMVMGVALELSTGQKVNAAPELAARIDTEAQRVIAATGQSKPEWLGKPDTGFMAIDYTRFKPRGFYADDPAMAQYFRATSWLQSIPFRANDDVEFATFILLYRVANESKDADFRNETASGIGQGKWRLEELLGTGDDVDSFGGHGYNLEFGDVAMDAAFLAEKRKDLSTLEPGSEINDQIAVPAKNNKPQMTFRVLSAHTLPDALLFAKTEATRKGSYPGGLDLAAAFGSPIARKMIQSKSPALLKALDADAPARTSNALYGEFLGDLASLLGPRDKAAPPLFHSAAWDEKCLQTFLGGWAQARHAWVLQSKQNVEFASARISVPSGFVEPVPDFFGSMSLVASQSANLFDEVLGPEGNIDEVKAQIGALWEMLKLDAAKADHSQKPQLSDRELLLVETWYQLIVDMADDAQKQEAEKSDSGRILAPDDPALLAPQVGRLVERLESGNLTQDERDYVAKALPDTKILWYRLALLCAKLEALSQKQLRGISFSKEDNDFITHYGEELAGTMFYGGNSYDDPRDDAPRICDVFTDPNENKVLLTGIGRPAAIYLLYPFAGKQILVHGAVSSYYEFPSDTRLTDREWQALLDSKQPPSQPAWLGTALPAVAPQPIAAPK